MFAVLAFLYALVAAAVFVTSSLSRNVTVLAAFLYAFFWLPYVLGILTALVFFCMSTYFASLTYRRKNEVK